MFGQIKYKYQDIEITQKEIQIQKEIYKTDIMRSNFSVGLEKLSKALRKFTTLIAYLQ